MVGGGVTVNVWALDEAPPEFATTLKVPALPMSVAGKTGTAQLDKGAPHSWFVGFAPYDKRERRVAFTVLVEHGGYGAKFAAPIAREFVEALTQLGMLGPEPERR